MVPGLLRVFLQEDINFLLTNRIPRRLATRLVGWFSKIRFPPVRILSFAVWRFFDRELDLSEAAERNFRSLHDCFIRRLRPECRPIYPAEDTQVSPCDAIVGAFGQVQDTKVFQAKGFPYSLGDLLEDQDLVEQHRDGLFITLRLKSSFYHRFHAPCDANIRQVHHISGDTWNVNPIALRRVEKLFCKNERAVIQLRPVDGAPLTLVPVAAILVASLVVHCLPETLGLTYRGPSRIDVDTNVRKGEELGYFQHGSTIILFASPGYEFCPGITEGKRIRMGEPLLRWRGASTPKSFET